MKRLYITPEAELLSFRAAEAVADELTTVSTEYEEQFGFQDSDGNPWG